MVGWMDADLAVLGVDVRRRGVREGGVSREGPSPGGGRRGQAVLEETGWVWCSLGFIFGLVIWKGLI